MLTKQGESLLVLYLPSCGDCMSEFSFSVAVHGKSTLRDGFFVAPRQSEKVQQLEHAAGHMVIRHMQSGRKGWTGSGAGL